MRRGWIAVVTCLWFSASGWALPVQDGNIYPPQAGPGERVNVRVDTTDFGCTDDGQRSNLQVYIGSVRADPTTVLCDTDQQERRILTFAVPNRAAPGPQQLRVLEPGEPPPTRADGAPNFAVLPPEVEYLVVQRGFSDPEFDFGKKERDVLDRLKSGDALLPTGKPLGRQYLKALPRPDLIPDLKLTPLDMPSWQLRPGSLRVPFPVPSLPPRPFPGSEVPFPSPGTSPVVPPFSPSAADLASSSLPGVAGAVGGPVVKKSQTYEQESIGTAPTNTPDYADKVCGSRLYILRETPSRSLNLPPIFGLTIERGRADGLLIAPDTVGRPPGLTSSSTGVPASEGERLENTWVGLRSIGAFVKRGGATVPNPDVYAMYGDRSAAGRGVHIFILDTLAGNGKAGGPDEPSKGGELDSVGPRDTVISGSRYTTRGHGEWIRFLLTDKKMGLVPGATVYSRPTCSDTRCALDKIIVALCDAGALSASGKRVIVNASFSTPHRNVLLEGAIEDALHAGVAVVTAFGNNDRWLVPKDVPGKPNSVYNAADYCNAYPADQRVNLQSGPTLPLYSVGANQQHNTVTQTFERGQRDTRIGITACSTQARPSIAAPSSFWFRDPQAKGELRPYHGTSFSAPLLVGALVLWQDRHPKCTTWPDLTGMTNLNIPGLLQRDCVP